MKVLTTIALIGALLFTPSCGTVQNLREDLNNMDEQKFLDLRIKAQDAGAVGMLKLKEVLKNESPQALATTEIVLGTIIRALENDQLTGSDVVGGIVDALEINLEPRYHGYLRDGARLIDAAVGQIRVDISGKLSLRERQLVTSFLVGLIEGIHS